MPAFTHADYLRMVNPQGIMEDTGGLLNQSQWDALNPTDQLYTMGGMLSLRPGDDRYNDLAATTKPELGRSINIVPGQGLNSYQGVQTFNDPNRVQRQDGWHAYSADNQTAQSQDQNDSGIGGGDDKYNWLKGLAFVGGGAMAANGLLGAAAATPEVAASTGGFDFSLMNPVTSGEVAQFGADFVPGGSAAGSGGGLLGGGYADAGMIAPGMGNSAAADSFLINNGMSGMAGGNMTGALSPSAWGGMAGNLGNWAMSNPLQALGAIQTVGDMLGGRGGGGGAGSGSKPAGGTGVPTKLERPAFQQNPYLAAQLRQGGYQ